MQLTHIFEVLLLVAILAGTFVGWKDQPVAEEEPQDR